MLHDRGQVLGIARVSEAVTHLLDGYGIAASIGTDHIHPTNRAALSAFLAGELPAHDG